MGVKMAVIAQVATEWQSISMHFHWCNKILETGIVTNKGQEINGTVWVLWFDYGMPLTAQDSEGQLLMISALPPQSTVLF